MLALSTICYLLGDLILLVFSSVPMGGKGMSAKPKIMLAEFILYFDVCVDYIIYLYGMCIKTLIVKLKIKTI